jgi:hypoxanthine phosphoribosyltransferase
MKYLETTIRGRKIYGLHVYGSKFALAVHNRDNRYKTQTDRVYEFKKKGKYEDLFCTLIEEAQEFFQCSEAWAVPSSTAGTLNILQSKYGEQIKRVKDAEKRKYNHACIPDLSGLVLAKEPTGKKIMLVDDVCTTGKTLCGIAETLEAEGASVICFCLGMNVKLFQDPPDVLEIEQEVAHRLGRNSSGEKHKSTLPVELVEKWTQSYKNFKQEKMKCQEITCPDGGNLRRLNC